MGVKLTGAFSQTGKFGISTPVGDTSVGYNDGNASVNNATYTNNSFSISTEDSSPRDIWFNPQGTKMFIAGASSSSIYQYTLGTGFDITTASYDSVSLSVAAQSSPEGIAFSEDGTTLYMQGDSPSNVYEYTLTTGFDLSTASLSTNYSQGAIDPKNIWLNLAGTLLFIVDNNSNEVQKHTMSAFDLSTASGPTQSFNIGGQEGNPNGLYLNSTGTKMFVSGTQDDTVFEYDLSTAFDLSTASYSTTSFSVNSEASTPTGLYITPAADKMFICDVTTLAVYEYTL